MIQLTNMWLNVRLFVFLPRTRGNCSRVHNTIYRMLVNLEAVFISAAANLFCRGNPEGLAGQGWHSSRQARFFHSHRSNRGSAESCSTLGSGEILCEQLWLWLSSIQLCISEDVVRWELCAQSLWAWFAADIALFLFFYSIWEMSSGCSWPSLCFLLLS